MTQTYIKPTIDRLPTHGCFDETLIGLELSGALQLSIKKGYEQVILSSNDILSSLGEIELFLSKHTTINIADLNDKEKFKLYHNIVMNLLYEVGAPFEVCTDREKSFVELYGILFPNENEIEHKLLLWGSQD